MTIQQLKYILEVSRAGSISQAADHLFLAQSNLSSSIRSLEEELGVQIFNRSNHGVRPTEKGRRVLEMANQILESYAHMRQISRDESPLCVRFGGVAYEPVNFAYVRLCQEYTARSLFDFSFYSLSMDESVDMLDMAMLDLSIQTAMSDNGPNSLNKIEKNLIRRGICVTVLAELPFVLRIGPNHPLYHKADISPEDINPYPVVEYCGNINYGSSYVRTAYTGNADRVFRVMDRTDRHRLIATTDAVGFGLPLPLELCRQYQFREYPIGGTNCLLFALHAEGRTLGSAALRYFELLNEETKKIQINK